jgi:anion-transporting  ArsA/GET3 family ATPase
VDLTATPQLIIITGKGGVGKTSVALALTKHLKENCRNVLYSSFDQLTNTNLCENLEIPFFEITPAESAQIYVGKKLGSKTIASWVMKTPFFKSLFNMIPGLGMVILMGHIIEKLEKDPTLTIILDSPSSGHALTMLESSHNFKEMFGSGLIVQDIERMHEFLYQKQLLKTYIVCLPTLMAANESLELRESFKLLEINRVELILNDLLHMAEEIKDKEEELPDFLKVKVNLEKEVEAEFINNFEHELPHLSVRNEIEMINKLKDLVGSLC